MDKRAKTVVILVVSLSVAVLLAVVIYEVFRTRPANTDIPVNMVENPDAGLDNMINDLYTEETENKVLENEVLENTVDRAPVEELPENKVNSDTINDTNSSKEDRAIAMAKKEYGEASGIYFSVDAIDSEGRYIVSVHETETTRMIISYVVDLEKQTIVEE